MAMRAAHIYERSQMTASFASKSIRTSPDVLLVGDCDHITVGKASIIQVQLRAPGEDAHWGDIEHIELGVSLSALYAECGDGHIIQLKRLVDPEPVNFDVVPEKPGDIEFSLKIFLSKQMYLLQHVTFTVAAV